MTTAPLTMTTAGRVQGRWRLHVSADGSVSRHAIFLGIPYAAAPVGELRFAAPAPAAPWDGDRPALAHGATPQRQSPYGDPRIPEPSIPGPDTLTVNVTTPDPTPGANLPVLVWIHGGGFIGGSPASPWYGGQAFARDGVVTVAVSYRLGFEGFGWVEGATNNRGVLDWLAALTWVQDNIAAFGGDPSRVTIGGQSAGGSAVMRLLSMPAAHGLFSGVLAISPADAGISADEARSLSGRIARRLGVSNDLAGFAAVDERRVYSNLEAGPEGPPADPLVSMVADAADMLALIPIIDGELILDSVAGALASGVGAAVPLLIGSTAHEFNHVVEDIGTLAADRDAVEVFRAAGCAEDLSRDLAARAADRGTAWAVAQAFSDVIFRRCVPGWAGIRAATGAPTWAYDFRWESRAPGVVGSAHCVDVPFGFDILGAPGALKATGPAPQELADAVHGDWLSLVRDGAVDAPQFGPERTTITYGDDGRRTVGPAYALEERLWRATSQNQG